MDFNFFENDIFCQIFNMNLNKMIWRIFLKDFKENQKTFQEYSKNISPKAVTKLVSKLVGVVHVIPFAPRRQALIAIKTILPPLLR
jgi:hypothetical protein